MFILSFFGRGRYIG